MSDLDTEWTINRNKIDELIKGLSSASSASFTTTGFPEDLDSVAPGEDIEVINPYAVKLYNLACKIADTAEKMMIQKEVQKKFNDGES